MATVSPARTSWRQRILPTGPKTAPVLINGKPIAHRTLQKFIWAGGLGLLIGLFISGHYFGGTQVDWNVAGHHLFYLKGWWDDSVGNWLSQHTWFINKENWSAYRHNTRNLGAPAIATVGVLALVGGASKPAGRLYSWVAPLILLAVVTVMLAAGTWLELATVDKVHQHGIAVGTTTLVCSALLGFAIGRVTHPLMKGPGTRLQNAWTNFCVDLYWRLGGDGKTLPVWVSKPLAPPFARESAAKRIVTDLTQATKHKHTGPPMTEAEYQQKKGITFTFALILFLIAVFLVYFIAVAALGFIGHFLVGVFHMHIPYLAP